MIILGNRNISLNYNKQRYFNWHLTFMDPAKSGDSTGCAVHFHSLTLNNKQQKKKFCFLIHLIPKYLSQYPIKY